MIFINYGRFEDSFVLRFPLSSIVRVNRLVIASRLSWRKRKGKGTLVVGFGAACGTIVR